MTENQISNKAEYRVIYGDTDQMGVIYYGNYLRLFERGRGELIRERGLTYKEIEDNGLALPVTEAYCHYFLSAYYDDLLIIETSVGEVKRASIRFDYCIKRDGEDDVLATGHTIHPCTNSDGKIVRLPEFVLKALKA